MANPGRTQRGGDKHRASRVKRAFVPREFQGNRDGHPNGHVMSYEPKDTIPSAADAVVTDGELYYECNENGREEFHTHIIARKSLTQAQHLKSFPQTFETETVHGKSLYIDPDKPKAPAMGVDVSYRDADNKVVTERMYTHGRMVEVTNQRVTFKSAKNLLKTHIPEQFTGKAAWFKRETHHTKRRVTVPNEASDTDKVTESYDPTEL